MAPGEFVEDSRKKWNAVETLIANVNSLVDDERLTPLEGAKLRACIIGETFEYPHFHGSILAAPLSELAPLLGIALRDGRG